MAPPRPATPAAASEAKGRAGAAGETLFVAGFQWGPPTSFNPFGAPRLAFPAGGSSQLIYEALLRFNLLDGSLVPGLAKELQEPDDNTFVLPLQDGTKWSDGSELTAEDVAFTFDLGKQTALYVLRRSGTTSTASTATDPRTVTFKLKAKPYNPGFVKNVLTTTLIVPKAIWSKIAPDKITAETEPGAGRFRPVQARQGRPDPDQPEARRRLLGQGRLRHAADDRRSTTRSSRATTTVT